MAPRKAKTNKSASTTARRVKAIKNKGSQPEAANEKTNKHSSPPKPGPLTASEVFVDLDQSLELVKCVITAVISNVCWVRRVFRGDYFKPRVYYFDDPDASYETFLKGSYGISLENGNSDRSHYDWRILTPGDHAGIQKLLGWLHGGVADALKKKYLSTLQLSFYEGQDVLPSKLVEAYIISVSYNDHGVASLQFGTESPAGRQTVQGSVMLDEAKRSVSTLVEEVISSVQVLDCQVPALPARRIATMHLTYTKECPKDYNAPGFETLKDRKLLVNTEGAVRADEGKIAHHSLNVILFNKDLPAVRLQHENSRAVNTGSESVGGTAKRQEHFSCIGQRRPQSPGHCSPMRIPARFAHRRELSRSSEHDVVHTQESGMRAFQSIAITRNPHAATQDTQSCQNSGPTQQVWPYTQDIVDQIEQARKKTTNPIGTKYQPDELLAPNATVECECGAWNDKDNLSTCQICHKSVHTQCYGYLEKGPVTILVCYTCLLPSRDDETKLSEMKIICVRRKILYSLHKEDYPKDKEGYPQANGELAVRLRLTPVRTHHQLGFLRNEGILGSIKDENVLRAEYFYPEKGVAEKFKFNNDDSSGDTMVSGGPDIDNNQSHSAHMSMLELASTTEGTLSPRLQTPAQSDYYQEAPRLELRSSSNKRASDSDLEEEVSKRFKGASARSPFL